MSKTKIEQKKKRAAQIVLPEGFHIMGLSTSSNCWSKKQTQVLAGIIGMSPVTETDAGVPRNCLRITLVGELPALPHHEVLGHRDFAYGRWPKEEGTTEERARIVQACLGYAIVEMLQEARRYLPQQLEERGRVLRLPRRPQRRARPRPDFPRLERQETKP